MSAIQKIAPNQIAIDLVAFTPLLMAGPYGLTIIDSKALTSEQSSASIKARFLCVAQSVISLVILPFKLIFAVFYAVHALFSNDLQKTLSVGYSLISVGAHAMMIPAGLILACMPPAIIAQVAERVGNNKQEDLDTKDIESNISSAANGIEKLLTKITSKKEGAKRPDYI